MRPPLGAYVLTGGGLVAGALLAAPGAAWAAWSAESDGSAAIVRAAELPPAEPPRAAPGRRASSVVVRWPEVSVVSGVPVESYRVSRIDTVSGDRVDLTGSCGGLVTGTRCTDTDVPDGAWTYRVRAVLGDWTGSWSPAGAVVVVDTTPVKAPEPQKPEPQKPEPQKPEPQKPEPQPDKPTPQKPEPKPEKPTPEPEKPTPEPEKPTPEPAKSETPAQPRPTKPETTAPATPEPETTAGPETTVGPKPGAGPAETTATRPDQD